MLLAGDIGGTKTNLAIFNFKKNLKIETEATFKSADYPSLEAVAQKFLNDAGVQVSKAVFGVAGPVVDGRSKITNLPWAMSETDIAQTLDLEQVKLINDLEAIAYAVPHLSPADLAAINGDPAQANQPGHKAIIAPGTGLGEAVLFYQNDQHYVLPSEGGHTDFGPTTSLQLDLLRYLLPRFDHVSYERVCSGKGIQNIYAYLKDSHFAAESPQVAQAISQAADPTPIIAQAGLAGTSQLCRATLDTFVSILGAEAGNLALKVMATGGIYLGGGIPPKILPGLQNGAFMAAFVNKGRFADILQQMPVYVILSNQTPLLGAAHYGVNL